MMSSFFSIRPISALTAVMTLVCLGLLPPARAQLPGEHSFQTVCATCHTIGAGRLVGPDLAGVHERRSEAWLETFVKSPNAVISGGDAYAAALFKKYNGILMPDAPFSAPEIRDILGYIKARSSGAPSDAAATGQGVPAPAAAPAAARPASPEEIETGQDLFQGKIRFRNGGTACNGCHDVRNDAVIGGGVLAPELTTVFARIGGAGVKAILGQAPFPVMEAAYKDRQLTDSEITALVAFLEYTNSDEYRHLPRDYGIGLLISGVVGAIILFLLFGTIWRRRKAGSVHQAIYDRQLKSADL